MRRRPDVFVGSLVLLGAGAAILLVALQVWAAIHG